MEGEGAEIEREYAPTAAAAAAAATAATPTTAAPTTTTSAAGEVRRRSAEWERRMAYVTCFQDIPRS